MENTRHIEFFDTAHFEQFYQRRQPPPALAHLIEFFWETRFDRLWHLFPQGFSDVLFPNTGYTYLINLGTPFTMQLADRDFEMKTDGFLPRHKSIECFHQPGNHIFGIKFHISPVLFEKKVNFAEYREYIFPLSYLLDADITRQIKQAAGFEERVTLLGDYYTEMVQRHAAGLQPLQIVTAITEHYRQHNDFKTPIENWALQAGISTRTLQRYFEMCMGISSKKVLQILRIRKAVHQIATAPQSFHYSQYHYYDNSHFYKHLKQFLHKTTLSHLKPHLKILNQLHAAPSRA
jgi:AraC-like DNA-binding protein